MVAMNSHIEAIRRRIEPLREQIINHNVYSSIKTLDDLRVFMEFHVYAVWDFMSLLKSLQNQLTCTSIPWFPVGNAETRFLVNEIVVGEESDVDQFGNRKSHFELYLDAMRQAGAASEDMAQFINTLKTTSQFNVAFEAAGTPVEAREFVNFTFEIIQSQKAYLQAAIFTFGREDLIPGMFMSIIADIDREFPNQIDTFKYYLERHIEVDGDHHSHLALEMTSQLCGDNPELWSEAETAIVRSLEHRIQLWNGVHRLLSARKQLNAV